MIYVDNAATTKMDERVLKEMINYMKEDYGNASSIYSLGRRSKCAIEDARAKVASAINASEKDIYFTSGGTEADNTAILGIARANVNHGKHIITTKIEHPAVLETCKLLQNEGFEVTYLGVNEKGKINLDELESSIREDTTLISVMFANNEIGTIQPIKEIGEIARRHEVIFHTDAVQAIGSITVDVEDMNIDALSISGHKFYGPKGIGAMYIRSGIRFKKFMNGGHQEKNKRAGTENVASIVGIGTAIELAVNEMNQHADDIKKMRNYFIDEIKNKIEYIKINGDLVDRLPGNANISFRFIEGESLLLNLDLKGICASSGSACTSGSLDPSHVLLAIGLPHEVAHGSLRVTLGKYNTKEEIDYLINELVEIVSRLRDMSPLYEDFVERGRDNFKA